MSKMQLAWQRFGSLATAALLLPVAALVPPAAVKASPSLTQPGAICRGAAVLEPNDPDVRALRSLIQKYKVAADSGVGDRPVTGDEFAIALSAVVNQVRQNLLRENNAPSKSDIVALYSLRERFNATLVRTRSRYGSHLDSLQTLQRMTQQTVVASDVPGQTHTWDGRIVSVNQDTHDVQAHPAICKSARAFQKFRGSTSGAFGGA